MFYNGYLYLHIIKRLDLILKGVPSFYSDDCDLPILEWIDPHRKRLYTVEDIAHLLLHPMLQGSQFVSTKVPTSICKGVAFVVDLDRLDSKDDVHADDMGVWKNNGVDTTHVRVTFSQYHVKRVEKCAPPRGHSAHTYAVKRVYRIHDTDRSLKKLTACVYGMCLQHILKIFYVCII